MKQREKLWTPGPWYAVDNGHYFDISTTDGQYGLCIANVCPSKHLPDGNNEEANAQLISAAPLLAEELEMVESLIPATPNVFGGSYMISLSQDEVDQIRAALNAAYGDSQ